MACVLKQHVSMKLHLFVSNKIPRKKITYGGKAKLFNCFSHVISSANSICFLFALLLLLLFVSFPSRYFVSSLIFRRCFSFFLLSEEVSYREPAIREPTGDRLREIARGLGLDLEEGELQADKSTIKVNQCVLRN